MTRKFFCWPYFLITNMKKWSGLREYCHSYISLKDSCESGVAAFLQLRHDLKHLRRQVTSRHSSSNSCNRGNTSLRHHRHLVHLYPCLKLPVAQKMEGCKPDYNRQLPRPSLAHWRSHSQSKPTPYSRYQPQKRMLRTSRPLQSPPMSRLLSSYSLVHWKR
jgi:hypothetical protein